MSVQKSIVPEFEITTTTVYVDSESNPEQNYYFFAYKMTIRNQGDTSAQLMSRHWFITDQYGHVEEVKGPGVVGLQPRILPGQLFEYESACPLASPSGSMKGSYFFVGEDGQNFQIDIPEFHLIAPLALH